MRFTNSIILRVQERARNSLRGINRLNERIAKSAERVSRINRRITRTLDRMRNRYRQVTSAIRRSEFATRALSRVVRGLRGAFNVAGRGAVGFGRTAARAIGMATRSFAGLAVAAAGAIPAIVLGGANRTAQDVAVTQTQADAAGLTFDEFDRLRRFIELTNIRNLDAEGISDLIAELRNRLGEALPADGQGGGEALEALKAIARANGDNGLIDRLRGTEKLNDQFGILLDALTKFAADNPAESQTRAEQLFGGLEGLVANEIAALPAEFIENVRQVLDSNVSSVSAADVASARVYSLALGELGIVFQNAQRDIFLPILPRLKELVESVTASVKKFVSSEDADKVFDFFTGITEKAVGLGTDLLDADSDFRKGIRTFVEKIEALGNRIDRVFKGIEKRLVSLGVIEAPEATRSAQDRIAAQTGVTDQIINRGSSSQFLKLLEIGERFAELQKRLEEARGRDDGTLELQPQSDLDTEIAALEADIKKIREAFTGIIFQGTQDGTLPDGVTGLRDKTLEEFNRVFNFEKISADREASEGMLNNAVGVITEARQQAEAGITLAVQEAMAPRVAAEGKVVSSAASVGDGLVTLADNLARVNAKLANFNPATPGTGGTQNLGTEA